MCHIVQLLGFVIFSINGLQSVYSFHLPILAETFNTVRIYNLLLEQDHSRFLDACHQNGIKVWASSTVNQLCFSYVKIE